MSSVAPGTRWTCNRDRHCSACSIPRLEKRKLLVVSDGVFGLDIETLIRTAGWNPLYAETAADARALVREHDFPVCLMILPRDYDAGRHKELRSVVAELHRFEWIAVLDRQRIERSEIRRFLAQAAHGFLTLPLDSSQLRDRLDDACSMSSIKTGLREPSDAQAPSTGAYPIIGDSPPMRDVRESIERASRTDESVLITGATGTGKEAIARAIHARSSRASGPFVALNCAAVPCTLVASELFGHERGAFTDAHRRALGKFEVAQGGTLLLDEIGEMPLECQPILLRVLEERRFARLGGTRMIDADVRVIASTNRDLAADCSASRFRADLFYRLAVLTIETPRLCERGEDIETLAQHFLAEATKRAGRTGTLAFHKEALAALSAHAWPGNVRELRSRIMQAALVCSGESISAKDLGFGQASAGQPSVPLKSALTDAEHQAIESTLALESWNATRAAKRLGISRATLYRLLSKHGISRALA